MFTAPVFSANASWATYLLTKVVLLILYKITCAYTSSTTTKVLLVTMHFPLQEAKGHGAGLMAATILAMVCSVSFCLFFYGLTAQFGYEKN